MTISLTKKATSLVEKLQAQLESMKRQQERLAVTQLSMGANENKHVEAYGGRWTLRGYASMPAGFDAPMPSAINDCKVPDCSICKAEKEHKDALKDVLEKEKTFKLTIKKNVPVSKKNDWYQWSEEQGMNNVGKLLKEAQNRANSRSKVQAEKVISAEEADSMMQDNLRKLNVE